MRILVTGSAGFIGSFLVDYLTDKGHIVFGVDDLSGGFLENVNKESKFTKLNLKERDKVILYIKRVKPQLIYHLAADATEGRSQFTPIRSTETNYMSYLNLLVPAIKYGLQKIVLVSSMSVYGSQKTPFDEGMDRKPDDIYGISKASMENATEVLSRVYKFSYSIVRPHNVYGPRQNMQDPYRNVIAIFINRLLNGKFYYIYGSGNQRRAFSYIDDVVEPLANAGFLRKAESEIFNIGPTKEYSINELSDIVLESFFGKKPIPKKFTPRYLKERPLEVRDAWCTALKAERVLGYKTSITLEEGVKKMIDWAKEKGPQKFQYLDDLELTTNETPKIWKRKNL
jgi:UDP-glucose 4-epimerase